MILLFYIAFIDNLNKPTEFEFIVYLVRSLSYFLLGSQFGCKIMFVIALLLHIGEAIYVYYICNNMKFTLKDSLLWTFQTFLVGFPSLKALINIIKIINAENSDAEDSD